MANDKMTLKALVDKVKDVRETVEDLDKLNCAVSNDAALHDTLMHAITETYGMKRDPTFLLNGARNTLKEYADMLERLMYETTIPWPPSISTAKRQ